ncbi:MFS general substrate transporter [Cylindrobasidium torrendii FP15055 ss-10]|uniref:MFS general substrate transporter n=1 Tax=Cylindrobasidium torrendii FP15055 ss-10 TaxID=1314674 RepID=A0A0D7BLS1_9AGAR|nr:MFS general substrate transporter [Cylindrobasidium torrendii FP15055 ss-10]
MGEERPANPHTPNSPGESSGRVLGEKDLVESKAFGASIAVEKPIYVEFEDNDSRDPRNFSSRRKWAITIHASASTLLAASTAGAYTMGAQSMCAELSCTHFQATIGISMYTLGFGVVPLVTASLSEEFGRQPLYYISAGGFLAMFILIALAPNIQAVLLGRFLQGAFGSTWATMVAGSISDIWSPEHRGKPMAIFSVASLGGTGFGILYAGWIEMNSHLRWKWIEWIQMILTATYIVFLPIIMRETRTSIILRNMARKRRKETGSLRYKARIEDEGVHMKQLIWISVTRPVVLLITEPLVTSFSLWIAFAWGVTYALLESIPLVFQNLHHFNTGQTGSVFITIFIGCVAGYFLNGYQEKLYQHNYALRGPEARLYGACFAAISLPVGMFIYAWTSFSFVHWIAPVIGIFVLILSTYIIFVAVFTYLADSYGPYASSALAGQSMCRNLAAMAFPLFTTPMFTKLGYQWAGTLFACIATLMIPIPYVLFRYGPSIRSHSKFSRKVIENTDT